jgi:hypothetical protein
VLPAEESFVKRFLCSDLVILSIDGQANFVNLEEIWRTGAVVDSEEGAEPAASAQIRAGTMAIGVVVERVERDEYGYRLELRFVDAEWTPELFTPAHLTDLSTVGRPARVQGAGGGAEVKEN